MALWQKKTRSIKEILEVLRNRLDSASYEDDMIESLAEIYKQCLKYPVETGDLCAISVLKSIQKTEDKHLQLQILQYLSCTSYSTTLIDKITSDPLYSEILMTNGTEFFIQITRSLDSPKLNTFLSQNHLVTKVLRDAVDDNFHLEFRRFVGTNQLLKETFVFEGILEDLINDYRVSRAQNEKIVMEVLEDIKMLLTGSIKNQTYFIDNELHISLMKNMSAPELEIMALILQRENKNYKAYQKVMMDQYLILDAFNHQAYSLIYKIIDSNCETFRIFVERYLKNNISQLIDACDRSVDCFKIVEMIVKNTQIEVKSDSSFSLNTLQFNMGLPYNNLDHLLIENLKNKTIDIPQLIYVVFTRNEIDDICDMLGYLEYDEPVNSMCLFINLLYCKSIRLEPLQIISRLKYLRLYILENEITVDSLREHLVETISQMIVQHTPVIETQSYEMKDSTETVRTADNSANITEVSTTNSKSMLIDEVNNKIKGIFDKFKRKEQNKSNYDL